MNKPRIFDIRSLERSEIRDERGHIAFPKGKIIPLEDAESMIQQMKDEVLRNIQQMTEKMRKPDAYDPFKKTFNEAWNMALTKLLKQLLED